jgi:hypothetical protein
MPRAISRNMAGRFSLLGGPGSVPLEGFVSGRIKSARGARVDRSEDSARGVQVWGKEDGQRALFYARRVPMQRFRHGRGKTSSLARWLTWGWSCRRIPSRGRGVDRPDEAVVLCPLRPL